MEKQPGISGARSHDEKGDGRGDNGRQREPGSLFSGRRELGEEATQLGAGHYQQMMKERAAVHTDRDSDSPPSLNLRGTTKKLTSASSSLTRDSVAQLAFSLETAKWRPGSPERIFTELGQITTGRGRERGQSSSTSR